MSLFIDRKFLMMVSIRLEQFKQKSEYLWNCRCPICGDSRKNKLKARGYVYRRKSDLFFSCHNCGASMSFGNFLKQLNRPLYDQYVMERFKNESSGNTAKPDFSLAREKPVFNTKLKINLPTIESLPYEHPAKQELVRRKIPKERFTSLYYAIDYREFIHELLPEYDYTRLIENDSRIVIPFYDENGDLLGVQGREMKKTGVKYITIKVDDDAKKVFGLDKVDFSKPVYVVEGPLDAMFLDNSIAMMDATLYTAISTVGNHDYVFVYDNQPRNKDVCRHMKRTIELGQKICIWPKNISEKDINDMILTGTTRSEVQSIIHTHTFADLRAKLEFEQWRKV